MRSLIAITFIATAAAEAATVVTRSERITGSITAEDARSVTLKLAGGDEKRFERTQLLQVFDDRGDLIWQAELPPETPRPEQKPPGAAKSPVRHALILDFYAGKATGGIYSDENMFIDDARIYSTYSDGPTQYAQSTVLALGVAASYQTFESERWTTLVSYIFRTTTQSVDLGGGGYEKQNLSSMTLTRLHGIFYGKEAHFYPSSDSASFDLIGQIGYTLGSYYPLVTYNDYRTKLAPTPAEYTGVSSMLVHGPAGRVGAGITFRGGRMQFRLATYYQLTSLFLAEKTNITPSISSVVHDYYAGVSLGYGW